MEDKAWYQSKTVWAAILFVIITIMKINNIDGMIGLSIPWEVIESALAAFGLYGVRDAISNNK